MALAAPRRVVVVGLGSIGRRHARLLRDRGDLQVEWCEISAAARTLALQELGPPARVFDDFESMLESKPAAIVVATPHDSHAAQSIAALEEGIHVLCEKPLSDNLSGATAIARAAAQAKAVLAVGFQLHFHPALCRAKELIGQGELGSLHHVHALVGTYVTLVNSKSRYQTTLPGALFMDYAHQPDVFHFLTGETPAAVFATGGQGGILPLQANPNFAAVLCDYARPMITTLHLNYLQMPERHSYEIIGDRGWVTIDLADGQVRIGRALDELARVETHATPRDALYQAEHEAFFDTIAGKRTPESSAEEALISMRVVDASVRSWQTGMRIRLSGPPTPP